MTRYQPLAPEFANELIDRAGLGAIREKVDVPLAVTGGFRTSGGMAAPIRDGAVDFLVAGV